MHVKFYKLYDSAERFLRKTGFNAANRNLTNDNDICVVQNVPAYSLKEKNNDFAAKVAIKKKYTIEMSFQRVIHSVHDRYSWKLFDVVEQFFNPFLNLEPFFCQTLVLHALDAFPFETTEASISNIEVRLKN